MSTYGATNPTFTASYSGLVNGDKSSVVTGLGITSVATSASSVGGYAIVPAGGSASNYTITNVNGTLTVDPVGLAASPRQAFTRGQLLDHVRSASSEWQSEATVTEHIRRLRNKDRDRH